MYPENPEGTQVIVGSMNMGYISDTARTLPGFIMSSGREFHTTGPETWKLLGPKRRVMCPGMRCGKVSWAQHFNQVWTHELAAGEMFHTLAAVIYWKEMIWTHPTEHILYMITDLRFRISGHNNFHGAGLPRTNPRVFEEFWEFWRNVTGDDRLLRAVWCLDQPCLHHVLVCTLLYDQRCITFGRPGRVCCADHVIAGIFFENFRDCQTMKLSLGWKLQQIIQNMSHIEYNSVVIWGLKYVTPWWQLEGWNMSQYVMIFRVKNLKCEFEPGNRRMTESGSCLDTI